MRPNLGAGAGRWGAAHWKAATFGWLAFVILAVAPDPTKVGLRFDLAPDAVGTGLCPLPGC
jgi:hypothetical protein